MAYLATASSGQDYDYLFKVILIGDANVGKSSLISQFCNEKFMDTVASTVGVDFYIKEFNINGKNVKVRYSRCIRSPCYLYWLLVCLLGFVKFNTVLRNNYVIIHNRFRYA